MTEEPINLFELEDLALQKLPKMVANYYVSGANDEITLRENREAYEKIKLKYRVLRDISQRDISASLQGQSLTMPLVIAPTAFHKLAHPEGEIATVRAAGKAGVNMILSTLSTTSIEDVLAEASWPVWFQLYIYRDREATRALVKRAEEAGCKAIVLTADAQIWGQRERDVKNRFHLPEGISIQNLHALHKDQVPFDMKDSGLAAYVHQLFDPSITWKDVDWLCSITKLPVWIKGIVHSFDAQLAIQHGAKGIIVSNHGGRQLDTAPATISVLAEIAEVVDGKIELIVDGGIRRGTDVVKAIALGAKAVAIGRPVLWGLALHGEEGVTKVLEMLRKEISLALGLSGCKDWSELDKNMLIL